MYDTLIFLPKPVTQPDRERTAGRPRTRPVCKLTDQVTKHKATLRTRLSPEGPKGVSRGIPMGPGTERDTRGD